MMVTSKEQQIDFGDPPTCRKVSARAACQWTLKICFVTIIIFVFYWHFLIAPLHLQKYPGLNWKPEEATEENPEESQSSLAPPTPTQNPGVRTRLFLNNPNLCTTSGIPADSLKLFIIVLSSRRNVGERNLIRRTWGSIRNLRNITIIGVAFMLGHVGESEPDNKTTLSLEKESARFGDIISGDFTDTYRNLSVKAMMAYEWVAHYCPTADILVKTDDDVVINIFELAREVVRTKIMEESSIWCLIHNDEVPLRESTGGAARYYVPPDQFPTNRFPRHCAGVGYITPMTVARRMVEIFPSIYPVSTHEDVFITGVVTGKLGDVTLVERRNEWYKWHSNRGVTDEAMFNVTKEKKYNVTDPDQIFHKVYGTIIFYLIIQGQFFQTEVTQLWSRIVKTAILSDEI